jgi:hypothetical protein
VLGYRSVKPHDPDAFPCCSRFAPGHYACMNPKCPGADENNGSGRIATVSTVRHATAAEYAALPLAHTPIDGVAHQAVYMCDHCAEDVLPFCEHAPPEPQPCPNCGAADEAPCLRRDGVTPLHFTHADRPKPVFDVCRHAHQPDCPVFEDCPCTGGDPAPVRPKHPANLDGNGPDISRLLFDEAYAQILLQQHGVHWWQVREAASVYTQDNIPALRAEVAQLDEGGHLVFDVHGHEVIETVVIPIVAPPQP